MLRLLPFADADGPTNMAADEAMLLSAAEGIASLRLYGWSPATLSLGYFQPSSARTSDLEKLPWVRRATGGATLVHHHELTYALALPAGLPWQTGQPWMPRVHQVIQAALADLGVPDVTLVTTPTKLGDVLCFQQHTVGDLVCRGHKIGGSAQRKHRRALLQHGSILLRQSPFTPALPGLAELTNINVSSTDLRTAVLRRFIDATGWPIIPGDWTAAETHLTRTLAREKFGDASWNDKR